MTRDDMKALIRSVIVDMSNTYGIATEMSANGVGNSTGNISGFDAPLGPKIKRKLKDFEFTEEEEEDDDK